METISKELLSEVLGLNNIEINNKEERYAYKSPKVEYSFTDTEGIDRISYINLYELAHKCKEWAYKQGFQIASYKSEHNWIAKDPFKPYPYTGANTEPEAVFKACQWILDNKPKD